MSDSAQRRLAERQKSKRLSGKLNIRKLSEDAAAGQPSSNGKRDVGENSSRPRCSGSGSGTKPSSRDRSPAGLPVSKDAPRFPVTPSSPQSSGRQQPRPFGGVSGPMAGLKSLLDPLALRSSPDDNTAENKGAWFSFLQSTSTQLHTAGSHLIAGVMDLTTTIDDTVDIFLSSLGVSDDLIDSQPAASGSGAAGGRKNKPTAPEHRSPRHSMESTTAGEKTGTYEVTRSSRGAAGSRDCVRKSSDAKLGRHPKLSEGAAAGCEFASEPPEATSGGRGGAGDVWNDDFEVDSFEETSPQSEPAPAAGAVRPASCSKRLFCDDASAAATFDSDRSPLHPITPNPSSPQSQSEWKDSASTPPHRAPPTSRPARGEADAARLCAAAHPPSRGGRATRSEGENAGNGAVNAIAAAATTPRKPPASASREAGSELRTAAKVARLSPGRRAAGTPALVGTPVRRAEVRALKHQCEELTSKVQQFQADCAALMAENERLRSSQHSTTALEHDPMAEQLAFQLQHLLEEKAKLVQEKQRLAHENSNLSQLLEYATASIGAPGDVAWQHEEQDVDMFSSPLGAAETSSDAWGRVAEPGTVEL